MMGYGSVLSAEMLISTRTGCAHPAPAVSTAVLVQHNAYQAGVVHANHGVRRYLNLVWSKTTAPRPAMDSRTTTALLPAD